MDIAAYINSAISAFQKVVKPLLGLFNARSENIKLKAENEILRLEVQKAQQIAGEFEHRVKELEAPGEAKKLGHELCHCTYPPQIMSSVARRVFVCPRCNNKVNLNATVAFSD